MATSFGGQTDTGSESVIAVTIPVSRKGSNVRRPAGTAPDSEEMPAPELVIASDPVLVAAAVQPDLEEEKGVEETGNEAGLTELEAIRQYLSILANRSAPEQAKEVASDALWTTLSGGFDPELRLEIAEALIRSADESFHALLAAHLEKIRDEAVDFDQDDLARQAEQLLKQLDLTDE